MMGRAQEQRSPSFTSYTIHNYKDMSGLASLETRVNKFRHDVVKEEMQDIADATGVKIDKGDKTDVGYRDDINKIMLPSGTDYIQASATLLKKFREEETERNYNREYPHIFINDFLLAVHAVIQDEFGMLHVSQSTTAGKPAPNEYIQLPIGFDEKGEKLTRQGYYGSVVAPTWENAIIDIIPTGHIIVQAKLKFGNRVDAFLTKLDKQIKNVSVIRGKAVEIEIVKGGVLANPIHTRINTSIVLSETNERIINNLIIPQLGEESKTSMLLTGDFGTGKTETALRIGHEASKKFGRTFFYLKNADAFGALIPYVKNYQGALVFVEDVDQISDGDRDTKMNNLLNQLDGNELKNVNCTFVFTTNNHDKIHSAMRRPGRIDQIIHFDYCDVDMVEKIFRIYAAGLEGAEGIDFRKAAEYCPTGLQGAVVAEISRRAVHYANKLHGGVISTDRFQDAVASMLDHIEFMKKDQKKDNSLETLLAMVETKIQQRAFPQNFADPESSKAQGPYVDVV